MEIVIRGHSRTVPKKLARKAIQFYADALMSSRLHDNIHLTLIFKELDRADDYGYCVPYYEGMNVRLFDIEINNSISKRLTLESIAHEMVHLKQLAKSEWYEYDRSPCQHRWNGTIINLDESKDNYWLAPWEVEAYGMQFGLFRLFYRQNKELYDGK